MIQARSNPKSDFLQYSSSYFKSIILVDREDSSSIVLPTLTLMKHEKCMYGTKYVQKCAKRQQMSMTTSLQLSLKPLSRKKIKPSSGNPHSSPVNPGKESPSTTFLNQHNPLQHSKSHPHTNR